MCAPTPTPPVEPPFKPPPVQNPPEPSRVVIFTMSMQLPVDAAGEAVIMNYIYSHLFYLSDQFYEGDAIINTSTTPVNSNPQQPQLYRMFQLTIYALESEGNPPLIETDLKPLGEPYELEAA